MKCKVINIKIALYEYDEDDIAVPMDDENATYAFDRIKGVGEVCDYNITDITLDEEEIDV